MGSDEEHAQKSPKRVRMTIGDNEERQALYSENESSLIRSGLDSIAIKKAPSCRFTVENIEPTVKNSNAKCVSTTERLGDELMVEPDQIGDKHRSHSSRELFSWGSVRSKEGGAHNLALYEEPSVPFLSSFVKAYTTPGPLEREESKKKKADLGVMLGVYFPTIQHILGVTMFIRLFWIVGIAGLGQTFLLLLLCCLCTFLTCISLSAVATNGVVESGGAYFMISRNLGPEFGSAVGLLFYLANTVATAMYLVGGTEVFLLYLFPGLTFGGPEVHQETGTWGMMTNNLRIYSTLFLILEFCIVAMGVKFVQLLAPVSLVCVIASILAVYAGGVAKTLDPSAGPYVCMYDNRLLQAKAFMPSNVTNIDDICDYCTPNNTIIVDSFLNDSTPYEESKIRCINGYPGFKSDALTRNFGAAYMKQFDADVGVSAKMTRDVFQDVRTTFFVFLAIYFPAVTGIFTGANMSGDLKNPQASIPKGTIAAQLTTSFVYFSLALVFGGAIDPAVLRDKNGASMGGSMVVANLAWPSPWVLLIGSFLSTFGAALQCLCSAPRLLQSIAKDDVIPILSPFKKVTANNEPFLGLVITTVIAECAILLGAMDNIAAVVDFFFLMCYAFVNLVCALHSLLGAPNWRPRFKYYHWLASLLGAFLCFFIMFSTHWDYAMVSIVLCAAIYKYVEWKGAKKEWGDGIRGLALTTAQYSLMKIEDKDPHPKNWRPQLLLILSQSWSRETVDVRYINLLNLASQLKAGRGLTVVSSFIQGNALSTDDRKRAETIRSRMDFDMNQVRLRGFSKTVVYGEDQILGSISTLIQSVGLGGLKPNTMLISWPTDNEKGIDSEYATFTEKMHAAVATEMCLLVAKGIIDFPSSVFKLTGYIDVYWIIQDGGLCLLMAYLLKQHKVWRGCKLRIIAIAQENDNNTKMQQELQKYVYQLRIDAKILIVELADPEISKNAFERTLLMEERTKFMQKMNESSLRGAPTRQLSPLVTGEQKKKEDDDCAEKKIEDDDDKDSTGDEKKEENDKEKEKAKKLRALDKHKVHKMHTAVRLNELILEHSLNSQLVLLNLPKPPVGKEGLDDYIHYLEVLSDNINRIIFVRGTGKEVITANS
ncbi:hypothetical protein PFISCL1PPCAC_15470 [Pristionchus fissidentatus]|uniref:Amino acid permease n=1 Tax=Pristionchus fissidentatus TaxID=1538716 RepID=A0AAV5W0F9_9BILA|nr:hypothetical protein PFISCL1PPCAC_15470 [Pristionchus fissidentatus]